MKTIYNDNKKHKYIPRKFCHVCVEKAILWAEPNVTSRPISMMDKGQMIEVLEIRGTYFPFYKVSYQNSDVWISAYDVAS